MKKWMSNSTASVQGYLRGLHKADGYCIAIKRLYWGKKEEGGTFRFMALVFPSHHYA